jgi:hypothetical protein
VATFNPIDWNLSISDIVLLLGLAVSAGKIIAGQAFNRNAIQELGEEVRELAASLNELRGRMGMQPHKTEEKE